MLYPLSSVHQLIYESLHPETLLQAGSIDSLAQTLKEVKQEIQVSRLHLFSQLSQASGTDALRVIVYTCQAGYVSLIKRLGLYINQTGADVRPDADKVLIQEPYAEIRKLLISHLIELYEQYFPFFDFEQPVPRVMLQSKHYRITLQIANVRKELPALCNDPVLNEIVCSSLEQMLAPEPLTITYRQFHYLRQLLMELNRYCFTVKPFADMIVLTDFLIRRNFNEPRFIDYFIKQLRGQVTDEMSLQEQAEKWAFHVKEFTQIIPGTSHSLYPNSPPVKECLIKAAEQELLFLRQRISLLPAPEPGHLPDGKAKRSVATDLTVSQLGVMMRLLVDVKVIQHPNQTELLKLVAGCLTTTKTAQISAESLRVRYYNPDRASLAITKEYLLQMLKRLNEY